MLDGGGGGGGTSTSGDGLIDPSQFAAQSQDLYPSQIEESASRLRAMGRSVHGQVGDIDSSWGRLKSHYEAPEEQRVYDLMDPAVKSARELKSTLGKAADHLDVYASELRSLKPRLKDLERRAGEFHSQCIDGVPKDPYEGGFSNEAYISAEPEIIPWREDMKSMHKNEDLLLEYGQLHEEISTAATKCANSINDLVESWAPVDREPVTAEQVTNPEQAMPWGRPVEVDLGAAGDLGQGVLNVFGDSLKDMSPLVLGYNPDSGEDFKLSDLKNLDVRKEAVKDTVDLYWSTAKVTAAGWTQGGARLFGKEEPAWTRTKDISTSYDRAMTGWGAVIKYDHQAAKAGGDGFHAYKGEDKLETWAEMGTTVVLTVATGGGAAAVKGGTKSLGAGRAAKAGSDAPDVRAPKSLLDSLAKRTNPLRGIDEAVGDLGTSYPSGHGPGKPTNSLLGAVDDAPPPQKSPDAPVSNSINTEPSTTAARGQVPESGHAPASGERGAGQGLDSGVEPRRTVSHKEAPSPWTPDDVKTARERSGGVDHRTGESLRPDGPNGERRWHMTWDPEAREWVAENPGRGHTSPGDLPATGTPNSFGYDGDGNLMQYANERPSLPDSVVREVWERDSQVDADGNRYLDLRDNDGNVKRVYWEPGQSRLPGDDYPGWDMGHVPTQEYRKLREEYLSHQISKEEFLRRFKDPENYEVQLPSVNRSRQSEAP